MDALEAARQFARPTVPDSARQSQVPDSPRFEFWQLEPDSPRFEFWPGSNSGNSTGRGPIPGV